MLNNILKVLKPKSKEEIEYALSKINDPHELLSIYCKIGDLKGVKSLLKHKKGDAIIDLLDIDTGFNYPLCVAAENGHLDIVKYLVQKGANLNRGDHPLLFAIASQNMKVIKYLFEVINSTFYDINESFSDDIHFSGAVLVDACSQGNLNIIKYFIEKGANIHAFKECPELPLVEAAIHNHKKVIEYLILYGANINDAIETIDQNKYDHRNKDLNAMKLLSTYLK